MKTFLTLAILLAASALNAQTNALSLTNDVSIKHDVQISGGGLVHPASQFGGNIQGSFSFDPFVKVPNLWVGASQSIAWHPGSGSTDVDADWTFNLWDEKLYLNPGAFIGSSYGSQITTFEGGPEVQLQYYVSDSTYLYGEYDLTIATHYKPSGQLSIGIGWEF